MTQLNKNESDMSIYDNKFYSFSRFELRSISGHGQTILSCHDTVEDARHYQSIREARGEVTVIYDAIDNEPVCEE